MKSKTKEEELANSNKEILKQINKQNSIAKEGILKIDPPQ
jgi:chorismate mutase